MELVLLYVYWLDIKTLDPFKIVMYIIIIHDAI